MSDFSLTEFHKALRIGLMSRKPNSVSTITQALENLMEIEGIPHVDRDAYFKGIDSDPLSPLPQSVSNLLNRDSPAGLSAKIKLLHDALVSITGCVNTIGKFVYDHAKDIQGKNAEQIADWILENKETIPPFAYEEYTGDPGAKYNAVRRLNDSVLTYNGSMQEPFELLQAIAEAVLSSTKQRQLPPR